MNGGFGGVWSEGEKRNSWGARSGRRAATIIMAHTATTTSGCMCISYQTCENKARVCAVHIMA